jgi:hypothetical protein
MACRPELDPEAAAACAGCITEIVSPPALTSIDEPADNAVLPKRVDELARQVATLRVEGNRPRYRDRRFSSRQPKESPFQAHNAPPLQKLTVLQQLSASTTAASDTGRRIVPSPAPTTNK